MGLTAGTSSSTSIPTDRKRACFLEAEWKGCDQADQSCGHGHPRHDPRSAFLIRPWRLRNSHFQQDFLPVQRSRCRQPLRSAPPRPVFWPGRLTAPCSSSVATRSAARKVEFDTSTAAVASPDPTGAASVPQEPRQHLSSLSRPRAGNCQRGVGSSGLCCLRDREESVDVRSGGQDQRHASR